MRHWTPRIAEAVEHALDTGAATIVGLVLAPHYSSLSIEKYRELLVEALAGRAELRFVERWGAEPAFVALLAARARAAERRARRLHGALTARRESSTRATPTRTSSWRRPASSRSAQRSMRGPSPSRAHRRPESPGSAPTSSSTSTSSPRAGVRDVLLCPIGFVSDHLEIRWDLDTEAVQRANELGLRLSRIEMPNADPAFIGVLAGLVQRAAAVPSVT